MRWVCPMCNRVGLAPERPRKNDVRRYCLPCSKKTGRLVERTCAVLTKRREKAAALRAEKATRAKDLMREWWTVAGIDVRALEVECWRALGYVVRDFFRSRVIAPTIDHWNDAKRLPAIKLRRRRVTHRGTTGWAYGRGRITLLFAPGVDAANVREVVLHELAHCAHAWLLRADDKSLDSSHGHTFNRLLVLAAERLWGVSVPFRSRGYFTSRALADVLRKRDTEDRSSTEAT